jgi:hypothetical protein
VDDQQQLLRIAAATCTMDTFSKLVSLSHHLETLAEHGEEEDSQEGDFSAVSCCCFSFSFLLPEAQTHYFCSLWPGPKKAWQRHSSGIH